MALTFLSGFIRSQTHGYEWALRSGGLTNELGKSLAVDSAGNTIVVGSFNSSTINFGSIVLNQISYGNNIFIVKFDPLGNPIWAKNFGAFENTTVNAVDIDSYGNAYITGYFENPTLAMGTFTLINSTTSGSEDIFVAKFDPAGNVIWAKRFGNPVYDYGMELASDGYGNIVISGYFSGANLSFGSITVTNPSSPYYNGFMVKIDSSGTVLWAKSIGGIKHDYVAAVDFDSQGNIIQTGYFEGPYVVFGTDTVFNTQPSNYEMFIVKYDPAGIQQWVRSAAGDWYDTPRAMTTDKNDNIYVSGYYQSHTIDFGGILLTNDSAFTTECFVLKMDPSGNFIWANSFGGGKNDFAESVAADHSGNVVVGGSFMSPIFYCGSATLTNANSAGNNGDVFIAKFNPSGGIDWLEGAGALYFEGLCDVTVDTSGGIFATGYFSSAVLTFGAFNLINTVSSCIPSDAFVVKIGESVFTDLNTGNKPASIATYPNPSYGLFNIRSENEFSKIEVINLQGQVIYTSLAGSNETSINLSEEREGIYFLKLTTTKEVLLEKVCLIH